MVADKNRKKISIGVEDFKEIIDRNGYFVDKTPMLAELMESNTKVTLFTRPRRFGKTLTRAGRYRVKSNRESGTGRPDIVISTAAIRKGRVMIIEFKVADSVRQLEAKAEEALEQIRQQQYAKPFTDEGYPVVQKYGISFYKKECVVKTEE